MNKSHLSLILALGVTLSTNACSRNDGFSNVTGEMSSGGRNGALAIQVQFGSTGTGSDQAGIEALRRFFAYEQQQGNLQSVQERKWGREGEINFCAQFKDYASVYSATKQVGRIVWIGRQNGRPNLFNVAPQCDEGALAPFTNNQRGAYNQFSNKVTLVCENTSSEKTYSRLELVETIVSPDAVTVEMTLKRSSPTARYALISDSVTKMDLKIADTRSHRIQYQGQRLDVELWPESKLQDIEYQGKVTIDGKSVDLVCKTPAPDVN